MDYSKLSDDELRALKGGDYSKLSNATLLSLKQGDAPTAPKVDVAAQVAKDTTPQAMLAKLAPSNVMSGLAVATQGINAATGLDVTNPTAPVQDISKVVSAAKTPIQTLKNAASAVGQGVSAATDPNFQPSEAQKMPMRVGRMAGTALEIAAMPNTSVPKDGLISRAAESVDSLAGVPRGSSFALLKDPSKWANIFTSKPAIKAAYQRAVEAGENVAEDATSRPFAELAQRAKTGVTRTIDDLAGDVGPLIEKAEGGTMPGATSTPMLIRFRKAANDEIGRLKNVIERGLESNRAQNVAVERLVNYQEMTKRVNSVLDTVAPNFRAADAMNSAAKAMAPFRSGIKPMVTGTATAAAGTALQQGFRVPGAANALVQGFMGQGDSAASALQMLAQRRRAGRGQ